MTEQEWAEGSGSTWEDLAGDPRIVAGAEVLVGRHRRSSNVSWNSLMDCYIGCRLRVRALAREHHLVHLEGAVCKPVAGRGLGLWCFARRDLVCLQTADGRFTDEGRTLNRLVEFGPGAWHCEYVRGDTQLSWAERAGLLVSSLDRGDTIEVDQRRLAMALGRELEPKAPERAEYDCASCSHAMSLPTQEPCCTCGGEGHVGLQEPTYYPSKEGVEISSQTRIVIKAVRTDGKPSNILGAELIDRELSPREIRERASQFFAAPKECPGCHRPIDLPRDRVDLYGMCSDCRQIADDESTAHDVRPVVEDRSGEAHLAGLRRFLTGPHLEWRRR
jgi:hypothetical protein